MSAPTPPPPWPPAGAAPPPGSAAVSAPPPVTTNGFAVAALVLGLFMWCAVVPGILAVIFGNLALGQIARSGGAQRGRGLAIAGIVLGWIGIALLGAAAVAWLVYGVSNL